MALQDSGARINYGEDKAVREPSTGKGRYDLLPVFALKRVAKHYENGAVKYSSRNWEKGIPYSRCIDSAKRHLDQFLMGDTTEDHLSASVWNLMAIIHYQELGMTELNDLPRYVIKKERGEQ